MAKYARAPDMDSWLRDPRIAARGFAHRWQSSVAAGNGEDAFLLWWIDVPECLRTPYELYARLGGSQNPDAPEYQSIEPQLAKIFGQHATPEGILLRHQRLLWQANLPE